MRQQWWGERWELVKGGKARDRERERKTENRRRPSTWNIHTTQVITAIYNRQSLDIPYRLVHQGKNRTTKLINIANTFYTINLYCLIFSIFQLAESFGGKKRIKSSHRFHLFLIFLRWTVYYANRKMFVLEIALIELIDWKRLYS